MSTENKDSPVSPNDKALFLRVKFQCKSPESVEAVLSFLKTMTAYQIERPIPGVLLYHFSHPDPEGQPLLLQFFELYQDSAVFFEHSKDDKLIKLYTETFVPADKNRDWSKSYASGVPATNDPAIKGVCEMLQCSYPETVAGYLLPDDPSSLLAGDHSDAVLLISEFTAKPTDGVTVREKLKSIANSTSNKALMFHARNMENEAEASKYEITAIYVNNTGMINHVCAAKEMFQEIHKLSSAFRCQMFGEISPSGKVELEKCGFPVYYGSADAGYVLHFCAEKAFEK